MGSRFRRSDPDRNRRDGFCSPRVYQWNLQVQRELTPSVALIVNYVGNHTENTPYTNPWPNAFDEFGLYTAKYIPENQPVPNYGQVTSVQSGAKANYDGLQVSVRKQVHPHGLTAHTNYTWSHAPARDLGNGLFTYGDSLLGQLNPVALRAVNYGNADYDVRHQFSADYVYTPTFHFDNKFVGQVVNGWQWSGKINWRSGIPFSVTDSNTALGNYNGSLLATQISPNGQSSCGSGAALTPGNGVPCLNASAFLDTSACPGPCYSALSAQNRNQFRGPHYFDFDMALFRTFTIREGMKLAVGLQAFSVFNHPNFKLAGCGR